MLTPKENYMRMINGEIPESLTAGLCFGVKVVEINA
jgi:hypothetical protein